MKPKIYFGHPVNFYNTEIETQLIHIIENNLKKYQVENPNQPHHQEGYKKWKKEHGRGMDYYFKEVLPEMDAGIFLPFEDGMFGAGVYGEAEFLKNQAKPIYQITLEGIISDLNLNKEKALSIDDTRKRVYNQN